MTRATLAGASDAPAHPALIARQRTVLADGGLFIGRAAEILAEAVPFDQLSAETYSFLHAESGTQLYLGMRACGRACARAAEEARLSPMALSLCVFTVALAAREMRRFDLEPELLRLGAGLPSLDLDWCERQYAEKCLAALPAAGRA